MARRRKKVDPQRVRELNGGDEAYERHDRVQQQLLAAAAYLRQRAQERRQAGQA
jgi:hypothetical protein